MDTGYSHCKLFKFMISGGWAAAAAVSAATAAPGGSAIKFTLVPLKHAGHPSTMRVQSPTLTVTGDGVPVAEEEEWVAQWARVGPMLRDAVLGNVMNLGTLQPKVDPLDWAQVGLLSTELQAFGLMMVSAWRDWIGPDDI
ncbi:hypothetical protein K503DRAFT_783637 [Rhizopogon vinicolor AM-OR11-026]|uniref:Uncharacterized protein n=1 Tax=Rhizopogon vinicolor AM-OR11-026 TaxID=1314800 RepID=A0A1B7MXX3_9AGAM|nr:hypothetical protein K503DRAFT_783637 [Rhizopogon vinicolor AM-OR11-026]